jgi:hypothetical protein
MPTLETSRLFIEELRFFGVCATAFVLNLKKLLVFLGSAAFCVKQSYGPTSALIFSVKDYEPSSSTSTISFGEHA